MKTKVIFRKFKSDGEILALFPEVPHDRMGDFCVSYAHVGQHGAASPVLTGTTSPATPEESAPLKREIESLGYDLEVCRRVSFKMDKARREAARQNRNPSPVPTP
jgi:hypothetical protein